MCMYVHTYVCMYYIWERFLEKINFKGFFTSCFCHFSSTLHWSHFWCFSFCTFDFWIVQVCSSFEYLTNVLASWYLIHSFMGKTHVVCVEAPPISVVTRAISLCKKEIVMSLRLSFFFLHKYVCKNSSRLSKGSSLV